MTKSYPDQLGEWMKRQARPRRDSNMVAFLAVIDDVRLALNAGFAVASIWENLYEEGRIRIGYHAFLKHVRRHITDKEQVPPSASLPASPTVEKKEAGSPAPRRPQHSPPAELPGFHYNAQLKKEDLL